MDDEKKKSLSFALTLSGIFDFVVGSLFLMIPDTIDQYLGLGKELNYILGYALLAAGAVVLVLAFTVFKPKGKL